MVHVAAADAGVCQILGQVLRHLFGEGGHQAPLSPLYFAVDLADQIVDLPLDGPDKDLRVQKPGGTDDLLHDLTRPLPLIIAGGGGHIHPLVDPVAEFFKFQRPVVKGGGQAEAVIHQRFLPGPVAPVHGPDLGQRHMALVHEEQKILGKIVQQRHGRAARRPVGNDPGVVLDPGAVAQLLHHLDIVVRALLDPLGLDELVVCFKIFYPVVALCPDPADGGGHFLLGGHIVAGGIDGGVVQVADRRTGDYVDLADPVDLVAEKLHPDGLVVCVGRENLHRVAPDAEHVAFKGQVVSLVADLHKLAQKLVKVPGLAGPERDDHVGVVNGVAQAIDAGDGGHHDHIPPLKQA